MLAAYFKQKIHYSNTKYKGSGTLLMRPHVHRYAAGISWALLPQIVLLFMKYSVISGFRNTVLVNNKVTLM